MSKHLLLPPRQLLADLAELATRPKAHGGPVSANKLGLAIGPTHWPRRLQQAGNYSMEVVNFQLTIAQLGYVIIKPSDAVLAEMAEKLGYSIIKK